MGERLFERLKPVCIQLVRSPSPSSLEELSNVLRKVEKDDLQPLQQYVLLPLRIIIKSDLPNSSEIVRAALDTIAIVFQHSEVTSWEVFTDFFVSLSLLITAGPDKSKVADVSEELKHSTVLCLKSLIEASSEDVLLQLYSVNYLPPIGHTISLLLSLIEQEQLRQLKIDGMHLLTSLLPDEDNANSSPKLCDAARRIFCSFLPGISMALCRVIKGDSKQGQNVIKVAIATWTKTVAWIMCDAVPVEDATEKLETNTLENPASRKDPKSLVVKRTSDWLKDTAKKLNILIGQICSLKTSDSWQVRLALVHFARNLLLTCKRNLSTSVGSLLSLLVGFLADDWPQVSEAGLEVLKEFKKKHLNSSDSQLVEVLEENLHQTMTALPRLMRSTDDDQKLVTLNLIQGYLTLLGPKLNQFLKTSSHLHRLTMGLLQVLEFDVKDTFLLEQASYSEKDLGTTERKLNLYKFQSFSDARILDAIIRICHLLGYYGDLMLLVDHFLELFQQSDNSFKKKASFVLNHVLAGTLIMQPDENLQVENLTKVYHETCVLETAVEMVLEEYLSDVHWSLQTSVNQQRSPSSSSDRLVLSQSNDAVSAVTLQNIQNNTLLICLLLEGIGDCAMVLGPAFDPFLIKCLYPVLEKMASEKAVVRQTAFQTLQTITGACCYSSIPDLLSRNADYLVDAISSKLRHYDWYHQAPHVLQVTLQQCNEDMLPLLEDTVDEILWSLDSHFTEQASSFIAVLQTLSSAILRWFPSEKITGIIDEGKNTESFSLESMALQVDEETNEKEVSHIDDIREYFLEYLKNKRLAEGEGLENISDDEDEGLMEDGEEEFHPDQKKVLPLHVQIVIKILQRSQHLLATHDPRIRLKVLSIIQICVQVLANETDELLPMVHKIWPSLVPRFQDEEPLVICMACDTLATLSQYCRDFLRQRFSKDVLPKLISVLESSVDSSKKAGPAYIHTAAHKLQYAILNSVGPLCQEMDIAENELNDLSCACVGYLSCHQPHTLQEACKNAFSCFNTLEPDALWLLLNYVCSSNLPPLPSPEFTVIRFKSHPQGKEFESNVREILSELEHRVTVRENSKTGKE